MKNLMIVTCVLLMSMPLLAQMDLPRLDLNPYRVTNSLPGLKMSHSMGFEAGSSSSGYGYYLSRYTNHMKYQFTPSLELDLDLNFINYGSLVTKNEFSLNEDNDSKVLPEFSLKYRPSDNVTFQFSMHQGIPRRVRPWYER